MPAIAHRILFFSLLLVIPLLGYGAAALLQDRTRSEFYALIREESPMLSQAEMAAITIEAFCQKPSPLTQRVCQKHKHLKLVRYGAILAGLGGFVLPLGILLAGWLARLQSAYLARVFKAGLPLVLVAFFLLCTLHAAIALTLLHYGQDALPFFMFCALVVIVVLTFLVLARSAFRLIKRAHIQVVGRQLPPKEAPELWALATETARRVGALPPQHIVVGLDPGLFVSTAKVSSLDGTFAGRTFYCSLPLCRLLTGDELAALLGHELRHFKGWSKHLSESVYPLYRGTSTALAELRAARRHPAWALVTWPPIELIGYYLDSFSTAIQRHNRQREYAADRVGARVSNSSIYASALVKWHYLSSRWESLEKAAVRAARQGQLPANLSAWFAASLAAGLEAFVKAGVAEITVSHPTDIHPPLAKRLHYIHENFSSVAALSCELPPEDAVLRLIPQAEDLEEQLSAAYRVGSLE
jgi:Zn-dependent protease with chaperone function